MIDRRSLRFAAAAVMATTLLACAKNAPPPPAAVPVTVAKRSSEPCPTRWRPTAPSSRMQTVAIEPQVSGIITKIFFKEGDDVKEGQPLFEIDPRAYQAAYKQAQAVVERDRAQLANANSDVARYSALVEKNYVTSQQMEQVKTTAAALKATLAADEALAQQAKLNLQYATIRAPISGRAGSLQVRVGYLAKVPATSPLVTIDQIHPILVRFAVRPRACSAFVSMRPPRCPSPRVRRAHRASRARARSRSSTTRSTRPRARFSSRARSRTRMARSGPASS